MLLEEVVGSPSVDVHVSAHGHELRAGQVVERDVVVEELRDADDIVVRRSLSRRSDLRMSSSSYSGCGRHTLRKNSLNSSLLTTLSALRPSSFTVSCKNLAISIRTRKSFRCFSSCTSACKTNQARSDWLTAANCPSNVLGSMLGNSLSATGKSSSMNGITKNGTNGINRSRSPVVRRSFRSAEITCPRRNTHLTALSPRQRLSAQHHPQQLSRDLDLMTQ